MNCTSIEYQVKFNQLNRFKQIYGYGNLQKVDVNLITDEELDYHLDKRNEEKKMIF